METSEWVGYRAKELSWRTMSKGDSRVAAQAEVAVEGHVGEWSPVPLAGHVTVKPWTHRVPTACTMCVVRGHFESWERTRGRRLPPKTAGGRGWTTDRSPEFAVGGCKLLHDCATYHSQARC